MAQMNGFKGYIGYSLRELLKKEQMTYCVEKKLLQSAPLLPTTSNYRGILSDFSIKSFTSGCYYYNPSTGKIRKIFF
jgi:hypothetical protein